MKLTRRCLLFVCIVFLGLLASAKRTPTSSSSQHIQTDSIAGKSGANPQEILHENEKESESESEQPGHQNVRDAYRILYKLRPGRRRSPRWDRPVGFLSTFWYYAKKLFVLLFMNGPPSSTGPRKMNEPLATAVRLLEDAAALENEDAVYTMADMSFYGRYTYPRNFTKAFESYDWLADRTGNATAQHHVVFMYATGIGDAVVPDQAKALMYHTFAADNGDSQSQMTAAYRHHSGVATPRKCDHAVSFYRILADKAVALIRSGPPGGLQITKEAFRLADEHGGVYGNGASAASMGGSRGGSSEAQAAFNDVLEYLDLMYRKGEYKATFGLGRFHYEGTRALEQDYEEAKKYFLQVARRYWNKDGSVKSDTEIGVATYAGKAAGYLGRIFLRGEGTKQDFGKAKIWFRRGVDNGDPQSQYFMGLMHLLGLGFPSKDPIKAAKYFSTAADQDEPAAQVRLGALLLDQGDVALASKYFEAAVRKGHIEAHYYLAELNDQGLGRDQSCAYAAIHYKLVAEKTERLHSHFDLANDAFDAGDLDTALLYNLMAAEQGYEAAQANVAYILEMQNKPSSPIVQYLPTWAQQPFVTFSPTYDRDSETALLYWTRSAKQANIDSLVKMGDYYLHGRGVPRSLPSANSSTFSEATTEPSVPLTDGGEVATRRPDLEAAYSCYSAAGMTMQSAQALYNQGWMHEYGLGAARDFPLAKRYYDQCASTDSDSYFPVTIALSRLRMRSWWTSLTGGSTAASSTENANLDSDDEAKASERPEYTLWDWLADFLQADQEAIERELAAAQAEDGGEYVDGADHILNEPDDLADEYGLHLGGYDGRRRGVNNGPNHDYYGAASHSDEDEEDGAGEESSGAAFEALVITVLALGLAFLVYLRQARGVARRAAREAVEQVIRERENGERDAAQVHPDQGQGDAGDRGLFPRPGEPGYADWVAGGIGH